MALTSPEIVEMPADTAVGAMPHFQLIVDWAKAETAGLTDAQLDFDSQDPNREWMWWSIRRQISHIAWVSLIFAKRRCGHLLFPDGNVPNPIVWEDHHQGKTMKYDRVLDESKFWQLDDLLDKLQLGTDWLRRTVEEHTIEQLRETKASRPATNFWAEAITTIPRGAERDPVETNIVHYTLEGSLWMVFYENASHLRTVQRLKQAQGLRAAVELPRTGYLRIDHYWGDTDASGPNIVYEQAE